MSLTLPSVIAIKSTSVGSYLIYVNDTDADTYGNLSFHGNESDLPVAQFEVEKANTPGLVHIKCSHNNKYLRTVSATSGWLTPKADQKEEDKSKWSCTLFQPIPVTPDDNVHVRLFHVQRQQNASASKVDAATGTRFLVAKDNTPGQQGNNALDIVEIINLRP